MLKVKWEPNFDNSAARHQGGEKLLPTSVSSPPCLNGIQAPTWCKTKSFEDQTLLSLM